MLMLIFTNRYGLPYVQRTTVVLTFCSEFCPREQLYIPLTAPMCLWSDHVYHVICPPYKESPYVKVQSLKILINIMLTVFLFGLTRMKCHVLGPYLDFLFVHHIWHSFVSTAYTPKYLNSQPVSTTKYFKPSKMSYFSRTKVEDFN